MSKSHRDIRLQENTCGHGNGGICSMHLDLSGYREDELPSELKQEGYGGTGLSGSDDYEMPRWY